MKHIKCIVKTILIIPILIVCTPVVLFYSASAIAGCRDYFERTKVDDFLDWYAEL